MCPIERSQIPKFGVSANLTRALAQAKLNAAAAAAATAVQSATHANAAEVPLLLSCWQTRCLGL